MYLIICHWKQVPLGIQSKAVSISNYEQGIIKNVLKHRSCKRKYSLYDATLEKLGTLLLQ